MIKMIGKRAMMKMKGRKDDYERKMMKRKGGNEQ